MIVRLGWASLVTASLILSPYSSAQGEDQPQPSAANAETTPAESEPEPAGVVESRSEPLANPDPTQVDEEIESKADDAEAPDEPEPPQSEPAAEIFVPSEDISEDFAVPFPVDI